MTPASSEIYVMNADGSGQTRLTHQPGDDFSPAWSPNGKQIAFQSGRDGISQIYLMKPDGWEQTRLTNTATGDFIATWSPTGHRVAFMRAVGGGRTEIFSIGTDGLGETQLTFDAVRNRFPAWGRGHQ